MTRAGREWALSTSSEDVEILQDIDAESLSRARDAARRSGLTLAEWLDVLATDAEQTQGPASGRRQKAASGQRSTAKSSRALDHGSPASRVTGGAAVGAAPRPPRRVASEARADVARLTWALHDVADRLEALEHPAWSWSGPGGRSASPSPHPTPAPADPPQLAAPSPSASVAAETDDARTQELLAGARLAAAKALEAAVAEMAAQVRRTEARSELQALQARETVRALRRRVDLIEAQPSGESPSSDPEVAKLAERPDAMEAGSARALRTSPADDALMRLMSRVEEGQHHALASLQALQGALSGLEQTATLTAAAPSLPPDAPAPPGPDVAADAPAPEREAEAPSGACEVEQVEIAVRDLSRQVAAGANRSVTAINQMGHEVIRVAQSLEGRVGAVERRSNERAAAMGGEVSRLADAMDDRLARADDARAGAFEQLGGAIANVADQLTEAISASEARSATIVARGLDDVGERLKRAIHTMNTHYELAATELAKEIRRRDEQNAKPAAEPGERPAAAPSSVAASPAPERGSAAPRPPTRSAPPQIAVDGPAARVGAPKVEARHGQAPGPAGSPELAVRLGLSGAASPVSPPGAPGAPGPPVVLHSHRELIEQARAAARLNAEVAPRPGWKAWVSPFDARPHTLSKPIAEAGEGEAAVLRNGLGRLLRRRTGGGVQR